jgi:hypothetical protein
MMFQAPAFSDLVIDRYLAGELPPEEARAFAARIEADEALRARIDELKASRAAFSLSAPSFSAIAAIAADAPRPWWQRLTDALNARVAVGGALAAAAVMVIVIGGRGNDGGGDVLLSKGSFLSFVIERDGALRDGHSGSVVHPGDRLQFVIDAGAGAMVGVWSKDGAGTVSAYAPANQHLEHARGKHTFANSTRLDGVVGEEVLVGIRCTADVDTARIAAAVADGGELEGCTVARVVVKKVAR